MYLNYSCTMHLSLLIWETAGHLGSWVAVSQSESHVKILSSYNTHGSQTTSIIFVIIKKWSTTKLNDINTTRRANFTAYAFLILSNLRPIFIRRVSYIIATIYALTVYIFIILLHINVYDGRMAT